MLTTAVDAVEGFFVQQDDKTVTLVFKGMTDEEAQIAGESWTG